MSFDPFDDSVQVMRYGESRGFASLAALFGSVPLLLSGALILALVMSAPSELAAMQISDREMLRFAEEGYFPLSAAAVSLKRGTLAFCANLQTFASIAFGIFAAVISARRGFRSERARGWTNGVWIGGLAAICLAPSLFPDLTPHVLDYAITGAWSGAKATPVDAIYGQHGLNRAMLPSVFLAERGIAGAIAVVALSFVMHDLGYRTREALEDFGLIEEQGNVASGVRNSARSARGAETGAGPEEDGPAFGQRGRAPPPRAPAESADAQARRVLGVSAAASRREIERAYRSQMKRAHPDHGGTVERAAALNAARDALLRRS